LEEWEDKSQENGDEKSTSQDQCSIGLDSERKVIGPEKKRYKGRKTKWGKTENTMRKVSKKLKRKLDLPKKRAYKGVRTKGKSYTGGGGRCRNYYVKKKKQRKKRKKGKNMGAGVGWQGLKGKTYWHSEKLLERERLAELHGPMPRAVRLQKAGQIQEKKKLHELDETKPAKREGRGKGGRKIQSNPGQTEKTHLETKRKKKRKSS